MSEINDILMKLNDLPNEDITKKYETIKNILIKLEEIIVCYKQADILINNLNNLKDIIINNSEFIEKNEQPIINPKIIKDSNSYTKSSLIKKYMETYKKYVESKEYYYAIDINYYNNIMKEISDSIF